MAVSNAPTTFVTACNDIMERILHLSEINPSRYWSSILLTISPTGRTPACTWLCSNSSRPPPHQKLLGPLHPTRSAPFDAALRSAYSSPSGTFVVAARPQHLANPQAAPHNF